MLAITGDHSKQDQILLVKIGTYIPGTGRFLCVPQALLTMVPRDRVTSRDP